MLANLVKLTFRPIDSAADDVETIDNRSCFPRLIGFSTPKIEKFSIPSCQLVQCDNVLAVSSRGMGV